VAMIESAEREGWFKPGGLVVEATSGNTGVGLALAAAVKGYHCIFTMPDKMSQEKARLLRALGAEVIITPTAVPADHPDNYIMKVRAIAAAHPNAIFADQHYNPGDPDVDYRTTGPVVWQQTEGRITHFVCAPGTGGTVTAAGAPPGEGGRPLCRRLDRREPRGGPGGGASGERPAGAGGHGARGHRRALSLQGVQRRMAAREPDPRRGPRVGGAAARGAKLR